MSRVKEYLAFIPIVGTKYVYQRGVNGSFNFYGKLKTLRTQQGNKRKINYSELKQSTEG